MRVDGLRREREQLPDRSSEWMPHAEATGVVVEAKKRENHSAEECSFKCIGLRQSSDHPVSNSGWPSSASFNQSGQNLIRVLIVEERPP